MKFYVVITCDDCTFVDEYGCNDGNPWSHGPFDTREEAETDGERTTGDCGPWRYEIEERES